jgi:hypothetical protein
MEVFVEYVDQWAPIVDLLVCSSCRGELRITPPEPTPGHPVTAPALSCANCTERFTHQGWGYDFSRNAPEDIVGVDPELRREQYEIVQHGDWRDHSPAWSRLPESLTTELNRHGSFYPQLEQHIAINSLPESGLCVDVGCATGRVTLDLWQALSGQEGPIGTGDWTSPSRTSSGARACSVGWTGNTSH